MKNSEEILKIVNSILSKKDIVEKKEEIKSELCNILNIKVENFNKNKNLVDLLNNQLESRTLSDLDTNKKEFSKEIKEKISEISDIKEISFKDSLTNFTKEELSQHTFGMIGKPTFVFFKIKDIPTLTGKLDSQSLFINIDGNELTIGNYTERKNKSDIKYIDYTKFTEEISNNINKYVSEKDKNKYIDSLLPIIYNPARKSAYFNVRNKIFKEKLEEKLNDFILLYSKELRNLLDQNEINLYSKILTSKSQELNLSDEDVNILGDIKLFVVKDIKSNESLDADKFKLVQEAYKIFNLPIPYKEQKNIENNNTNTIQEKVKVLTILNIKKVNNIEEIVSEINNVVKNTSENTISYQDVKKEEEIFKKLLNGEKIKSKSLSMLLSETKDKEKKDTYERITNIRKFMKAVINDKPLYRQLKNNNSNDIDL